MAHIENIVCLRLLSQRSLYFLNEFDLIILLSVVSSRNMYTLVRSMAFVCYINIERQLTRSYLYMSAQIAFPSYTIEITFCTVVSLRRTGSDLYIASTFNFPCFHATKKKSRLKIIPLCSIC